MIIIAFLISFTNYKIMNVAGSKQLLFCPLNGSSYTTTHQDDKVANKCVHSLVSGFSHKSDHMSVEPTKDQTVATTHQDDKVANKCVHSLVSGFSHKSDHTSGEPAKDQTEAPQLYHRNKGTWSEPSSGCTQFCTWG